MVTFTTALSLSVLAGLVASQSVTNVFPNDTRIKYSQDDWDETAICKYDKDGKLVGGQAGCYNLGPEPCSDNILLASKDGANLTLTFKGTGIALKSLSQPSGAPGIVTVTLDGNDSTYRSDPVNQVLRCQADRFKADALDKDKEHTLTVTLRVAHDDGPAPPTDPRPSLFFTGFSITGAEDGTTTPDEPSSTPPNAANTLTRPGVVTGFLAALIVLAVAYIF